MKLSEKTYLTKADSQYLKAADLPENFSARLWISGVDEVSFQDDAGNEVNKLTIAFKDKEKGVALNKTNTHTLMGAFGDETDNWVGKEILLTTQYYPKFSTSGFIVNALLDDPSDEIPW